MKKIIRLFMLILVFIAIIPLVIEYCIYLISGLRYSSFTITTYYIIFLDYLVDLIEN